MLRFLLIALLALPTLTLHTKTVQFSVPDQSLSIMGEAEDSTGVAFSFAAVGDVKVGSADPMQIVIPLDYSDIHVEQSNIVQNRGKMPADGSLASLEFHTGATVGNPNAPVTMHIYCDFQSNFCKSFYDESLPQIINDFVREGHVKLVFHDFPRLGTDPTLADPEDLSVELGDPTNESSLAAQAAMCAGEQERYLEMSDMLFNNYEGVQIGGFSRANLGRFAKQLGLNINVFEECMDSGRYVPALALSVAQGWDQGITATPMFILDNGSDELKVIQNTAEGYTLIKRDIERAIQTAP